MNQPDPARARAADRRLIGGYGPVVVAAVLFMAMALLVPTVAPEQNVAVGPTSAGTVVAATPNQAAATAVIGNANAHTSSATQVASTGSNIHASSSGAATPAAAGAVVTSCSGPQVQGDPYSPPCISFSGSNGGATSNGVTANQIVITYMNPTNGSMSDDQTIKSITGHYSAGVFPETYQDVLETLQNLVTYFNTHFQFYGRKMVLKVYNGQEDSGGSNQSQVNADALNVADTIHGFAEINGDNQAYQSALAAHQVISLGANYAPESYYEQNSPYAWSIGPDCTELGAEVGAVAAKELAPHAVSFAGTGVPDGQPRRFAVLSDDLNGFSSCAGLITSALARAGHPATMSVQYSTDVNQAAATTQAITQQIINDKITTVLCICDSVMQLLVSGQLDNANYLPEWFNAAVIAEEADVIAQQMDQASWAHVALLTNEIAVPGKYGTTIAYDAAKSSDPNGFVVNEVDPLYQDLYQLALGIQLAGPDLTPSTFAKGMWSYQGGNGIYGPWTYVVDGVHYYSPIHQYRFQWYEPNVVSNYDGAKGVWAVVPGWFTAADPPATSPVFPDGPQ